MTFKTLFALALLSFACAMLGAQPVEEAYTQVEDYPVLEDCDHFESSRSEKRLCTEQKLVEYLRASLIFNHDRQVMGNTEVQFVVETDGSIKEVKLMHTLGAEFDAKIIAVFQSIKGFRPGQIDGIPVRTLLKMPISFQPEQALEHVEFANFAELFCKSYRNSAISANQLKTLLQNAPDSVTLCTERRKLKRATLTLSDPEQKSETFQLSGATWRMSDNLRQHLGEAVAGSRLYIQMVFDVSGIEVEVSHDLYFE